MSENRRAKAAIIARILLGVIFTCSGINYWVGVFEQSFTPQGATLVEALKATGFFWPLLKTTELICGGMLIFGYFGPLALFVLAPICFGIVCFHIFLSPNAAAIFGYIAFALEVFLLVYFRKYYMHIFRDFTDDVDHNPYA